MALAKGICQDRRDRRTSNTLTDQCRRFGIASPSETHTEPPAELIESPNNSAVFNHLLPSSDRSLYTGSRVARFGHIVA